VNLVVCPKCQARNLPDALACKGCGSPLESPIAAVPFKGNYPRSEMAKAIKTQHETNTQTPLKFAESSLTGGASWEKRLLSSFGGWIFWLGVVLFLSTLALIAVSYQRQNFGNGRLIGSIFASSFAAMIGGLGLKALAGIWRTLTSIAYYNWHRAQHPPAPPQTR